VSPSQTQLSSVSLSGTQTQFATLSQTMSQTTTLSGTQTTSVTSSLTQSVLPTPSLTASQTQSSSRTTTRSQMVTQSVSVSPSQSTTMSLTGTTSPTQTTTTTVLGAIMFDATAGRMAPLRFGGVNVTRMNSSAVVYAIAFSLRRSALCGFGLYSLTQLVVAVSRVTQSIGNLRRSPSATLMEFQACPGRPSLSERFSQWRFHRCQIIWCFR